MNKYYISLSLSIALGFTNTYCADHIASLQPNRSKAITIGTLSAITVCGLSLCTLVKYLVQSTDTLTNQDSLSTLICKNFLPIKWSSQYLFNKQYEDEHNNTYPLCITATSMSLGISAGICAYEIQPETIYQNAHIKLMTVINNTGLTKILESKIRLIGAINDEYIIHQFPKVYAHNDLIQHYETLTEAIDLFSQVIQKSNDQTLINMSKQCVERAEKIMHQIMLTINILRNSLDWHNQVHGYNISQSEKANRKAVKSLKTISANSTISLILRLFGL